MKYRASDISLAVSCRLLPYLYSLSTPAPAASFIVPMSHSDLKLDQLDVILNVSSSNLLKLITLTSGYELKFNFIIFIIVYFNKKL